MCWTAVPTTIPSPAALGVDQLRGGAGADRFVFIDIKDSLPTARDQMLDFSLSSGDVLDFSSIDAKAGTAGGQTFVYIGGATFTAEGQIRASVQDGHTVVEVNTKGVGGAEMAIELQWRGHARGQAFQADRRRQHRRLGP